LGKQKGTGGSAAFLLQHSFSFGVQKSLLHVKERGSSTIS
jgi:hypothetical protein